MKNINIQLIRPEGHINIMSKQGNNYQVLDSLGQYIHSLEITFSIPRHALFEKTWKLYSKYQDFFDLRDFGWRMLEAKAALKAIQLSQLNHVFTPHTIEAIRSMGSSYLEVFAPNWYLTSEAKYLYERAIAGYDKAFEQGMAYGIFGEALEVIRDYQRATKKNNLSSEDRLHYWIQDMLRIFFWGSGPIDFNSYQPVHSEPAWHLLSEFVLLTMNDNEDDRRKGSNLFTRATQYSGSQEE